MWYFGVCARACVSVFEEGVFLCAECEFSVCVFLCKDGSYERCLNDYNVCVVSIFIWLYAALYAVVCYFV